ncbi:MAG: phage tail protein [Bacteroides sp.]|nr:phage tail protein [Bacteroides sp.]
MEWELPVNFYFSVEIGVLKLPFREVSGLTLEMETEKIREGGENKFELQLPGRVRHPNLVLKRAMQPVDNKEVEWIKDILERDYTKPVKTQYVFIKLLNEKGKPLASWYCSRAFPVKWVVEPLNAEKGEVLIETLEFAYSYLNRK